MSIDLSVEIAGVKFPSCVMPGAGDITSTLGGCKELIESGVGGITTKTMTTLEKPRSRPRPHTFVVHGRGYDQVGSVFSITGNWPEHIDVVLKRDIPNLKKLCKESGVPLIISWWGPMEVENGKLKDGIIKAWVDIALKVDAAGADLQELNIANPFVAASLVLNPEIGFQLVKAVTDAGIKAGVKIQPSWEPLEYLAEGWERAGAKYITAHCVVMPGLFIDIEREMPRYAPAIGGFLPGRLFLPWGLGRVVRLKKTVKIPVIALGGVYTAEDALQYILGGASIVELHTAVSFQGTRIFPRILQGIETWMKRKGYTRLEDFRGKILPMVLSWSDVKNKAKHPFAIPPNTPYAPVVDMTKCSGCGSCERTCAYQVYKVVDKQVSIEESKCDNCGFCVTLCPKEAITLVDKANRNKVVFAPGDLMAEPLMDMLNDLISQ